MIKHKTERMTPLPGLVYGTLGLSVVLRLVWMNGFSVGAGIKKNSTQNNNWENALLFTAHREHKSDLIWNKANYVRIKKLKVGIPAKKWKQVK